MWSIDTSRYVHDVRSAKGKTASISASFDTTGIGGGAMTAQETERFQRQRVCERYLPLNNEIAALRQHRHTVLKPLAPEDSNAGNATIRDAVRVLPGEPVSRPTEADATENGNGRKCSAPLATFEPLEGRIDDALALSASMRTTLMADRAFDSLDTNHDGLISRDEWMTSQSRSQSRRDRVQNPIGVPCKAEADEERQERTVLSAKAMSDRLKDIYP